MGAESAGRRHLRRLLERSCIIDGETGTGRNQDIGLMMGLALGYRASIYGG
jgi:hypothetical protein